MDAWNLEGVIEQNLSAIQAVMEEERDRSELKLVVCGSAIAQMEALQSERNPLHGRLVPLELRALPYGRAIEFLDADDPLDRFTPYAIAGAMPRYLPALAGSQEGPSRVGSATRYSSPTLLSGTRAAPSSVKS
jgi:hypothetical protein